MATLKLFLLIFLLAMAACSSNAPFKSEVKHNLKSAKLSFLDIAKFDRDLSGTLQENNASVEVAFHDKVSPNNVPDRIQKWISVVEAGGGKIFVEPLPNESVSRSPLAALSLVSTLITSIKGFAKFNSERIYDSAKGRDAIISLERSSGGDVVIKAIKFVKR